MSHILEISNLLKIEQLLFTIEIKRLFDSHGHLFLVNTLEKFGFGKEPCIINGGTTTESFKLDKGPFSLNSRVSINEMQYMLIFLLLLWKSPSY